MSSRATSDKSLYENDPFYRHLTLTRARYHRVQRKRADNARRRRRAQDPEVRDKARARRYGLSLQEYRAILARQGHACAILPAIGLAVVRRPLSRDRQSARLPVPRVQSRARPLQR
jgi:hypothetical protein